MKIILIGAGNVATHLGKALKSAGMEILQVFSRTEESAKKLGEQLNVQFCSKWNEINQSADIYIFSIKDSVLEEAISHIYAPQAIYVHTAGSVSIDIFEKKVKNYGVVYPLQTFSKNKEINIQEVPFFIEASNKTTENIIKSIVGSISNQCYNLSSEKRMLMHLAAVFACNFSNYMYVLASEITSEAGIDFKTMLPLIKETADKVSYLSPEDAQTGPAIRKDEKTIKKHIDTLANKKHLQYIYRQLSESIEKMPEHK